MENIPLPDSNGSDRKEYKRFAAKRIVAGILITALVIWMASLFFGFFDKQSPLQAERVDTGQATRSAGRTGDSPPAAHDGAGSEEIGRYKDLFQRKVAGQGTHLPAAGLAKPAGHGAAETASGGQEHSRPIAESGEHAAAATAGNAKTAPAEASTAAPAGSGYAAAVAGQTDAHPAAAADASHPQAPAAGAPAAATDHAAAPAPVVRKAPGVAFVEAMIKPLDYELNQRFWGWRPNDIIDLTDNVNNFQLGVLEVTRRTTIVLTERISRIGSAASFDQNMEQAMNWFMIKPSRYMLPGPEDKYGEGIDNLRQYADKLQKGLAHFYTRTDSLIPLLSVYQDLLGSCDENLVKAKEGDGENVSSFKADDYFFYAQGVASAMMGILEAVRYDFDSVLESRMARDAIHHAIESLHHATAIRPWIILNSDLSSIFANHRANMAAPISHARFYLGVAIGALST